MAEAIKEVTHALLQRGDTMQTRNPAHPPAVCIMTNAYDAHMRVFWLVSKGGTVSNSHVRTGESVICIDHQKRALQIQKQKNPWGIHQPSLVYPKKSFMCL